MSKKTATEAKVEAPAVQESPMPQAVVARKPSTLESLKASGASPDLIERVTDVIDNLALIEDARIPKIKPSANGLHLNDEDEPVMEMEGVIIYGKKYSAYYKKAYDKKNVVAPDCYSNDGKVPAEEAGNKQSKTCKTCPQNEWETANVGKGKACRNIRQLYLLTSVAPGDESLIPRQLSVTPTSLKAIEAYLLSLVERGLNMSKVVTKITATLKDPDDKFVVLSFARKEVFDAKSPESKQVLANIGAIRSLWLPLMQADQAEAQDFDEGQADKQTPTHVEVKGEF